MEQNTAYQDIHKFLIDNDWSVTNNEEDKTMSYKKEIQRNTQNVMIVNGQMVQQEPIVQTVIIIYIGEGYMDDCPIYGFTLNIDNNDMYTQYVDSLEDFKKEIYEKLQ